MENRKVPSLSTDGWVVNPILKLNKLYLYFLSSSYTQTTLYPNEIASLKYLLEQAGHDPKALVEVIESTLTTLLKRYYTTVTVNAHIDDSNSSGSYSVIIDASVVDGNGEQVTLSKAADVVNGKINSFNDHISELYKN